MGCNPTRVLRDEHQLILKVVGALERLLDGGGQGGEGPASGTRSALRDCVDFFRLYTDALHHGKEEDLLFDSLVDQGFPRHTGPIAMMLQEHELGRAYVGQMDEALDRLEDGENAWSDLDHAGRGYIDLLRRHIGKEDNALFAMADDAIDEAECRRLCGEYDHVCARRFEGRTMAELEQLASEIVEAAS